MMKTCILQDIDFDIELSDTYNYPIKVFLEKKVEQQFSVNSRTEIIFNFQFLIFQDYFGYSSIRSDTEPSRKLFEL